MSLTPKTTRLGLNEKEMKEGNQEWQEKVAALTSFPVAVIETTPESSSRGERVYSS